MKCCKLFLVSAASMVAGALIYKTVKEHKEEIDSFINEYGEFIEDDLLEAERTTEEEA